MNREDNGNVHSVGKGKTFIGKEKLVVTKETYKDRNVNFHKYVKGLMLGMLEHNDYKTLNLQSKTYIITLSLSIVPEELLVVPEKKLIKVVE